MDYFKIEQGVVVNTIVATPETIDTLVGTYVLAQDGYGIGDLYDGNSFSKPVITLDEHEIEMKRERAIVWRNQKLSNTDSRSLVTDDPDHQAILTFRQALRDWPSTDDFPDIRPTL